MTPGLEKREQLVFPLLFRRNRQRQVGAVKAVHNNIALPVKQLGRYIGAGDLVGGRCERADDGFGEALGEHGQHLVFRPETGAPF